MESAQGTSGLPSNIFAGGEVENLRNLIEHAPAAMALVSGPEHVFQMANQAYIKVTGRSEDTLLGRRAREALPEIGCQGFVDLLDQVYRTSEPFVGTEVPAKLDRNHDGNLEDRYFNFVYQPWKDGSGRTRGVFIHAVDVTEQLLARRRLEETIAERERDERARLLLGAIVDSSDDAIISKDLNGIITSWNKAAERLFGYTADEVVGKSITILIPRDRLGEEPEILAKLQRGERVDHFETIRKRKDGSTLNISLTISPVRDARGKIIGASKIARDITERKRAEQAIQVLNLQLTSDLSAMARMQRLSTRLVQAGDVRQLLDEIIEAGMEITGADMGNIQLVDGQGFRGSGLETIAQRGFDEAFQGAAACGTALPRGERVIVEDIVQSPIFVGTEALDAMLAAGVRAMQSTPLISRSGQVLGMFSTHYTSVHRPDERELRMLDVLARQAADAVERMRSEEQLRYSEARFRELAEVGPQFIWVCEADGEVEYVNRRWMDYSGLDLEATKSSGSMSTTVHTADREGIAARWRRSLESGEPFEMEARLRRWDGTFRWFVIRCIALRDDSGRIVKWFGSSTDIDGQKQVENELRRVNQDLEQFAYSASHDLQEPLRSVKIYSQLLAERHGDKLDGQALEFLGYLRASATRMEVLIRDLLAYTQVTKLDTTAESTDANDALKAVLSNLKQAIADSDARITSSPLPMLRMHSVHLTQVLQNLIGNAIKYRSADRIPEIHVSAARQNGDWAICVRDNGIGIEPEYKERVFGLFKRLHTEDEYSGTGIGLAICQRIVERYHGRIWVESEPGQGSTFIFTVPV